MGRLATAQVGGEVKRGMGNALGLQQAWNVQAGVFLQAPVHAGWEIAFPSLWVEPEIKRAGI